MRETFTSGSVGRAPGNRCLYPDNDPAFMRDAYRSSLRGTYTLPNLGFRCAKDLP